MKKIVLILIAAILCSISACTKNNDPGPGNPSIVGKWRWVKSVGGIGGTTVTPQTDGYTYRFEFGADSVFKDYQNDKLLLQSNYHISKNYKYDASMPAVDLLKIETNSTQVAYVVRHDSLYFDDIFIADGFNSVYVRIK
ncbi:hypothetical protein AAFN85_08315 [Mucilaginibacter sp. CAU 1740]|uniref:hypothetical protein n=1 Tax=Mucilaginibacter sp. CAU 1740 TaxID=3140365 RepID=UPI00325B3963